MIAHIAKYWWLYLIAIIGLWYAFGRKWQFMSYCKKTGEGKNEQWNAMSADERNSNCERMYNGFKNSSVG